MARKYTGGIESEMWRDPLLLGKYFFNCIEHLETIESGKSDPTGTKAYASCMDYILSVASGDLHKTRRRGTPTYILVRPGIYNGKNQYLKETIDKNISNIKNIEGVDKYRSFVDYWELTKLQAAYAKFPAGSWRSFADYVKSVNGLYMEISRAIAEFYIYNEYAHPESSKHCKISTISTDNAKPKEEFTNCMTYLIELEALNGIYGGYRSKDLFTSPAVVDLVNDGTRCGVFFDRVGRKSIYRQTSCMEALIKRELKLFGESRAGYYGITPELDKYDLEVDCTHIYDNNKRMPCIQSILQNTTNFNYIHVLSRTDIGGYGTGRYLKDILSTKYKFEKLVPEYPDETTAIDYMAISGTNLGAVRIPVDPLCLSEDGSQISCLGKVLTNLSNYDNYYSNDTARNIVNSIDDMHVEDLFSGIVESTCFSGSDRVSCFNSLIDAVNKYKLSSASVRKIVEKVPPSDLDCSVYASDGTHTIKNCLDKIIETSNANTMQSIVNSGLLIDRMDCTDWDKTPMTCIDKLFQRHQMWAYALHRAVELSDLSDYYAKTKQKDMYAKVGLDVANLSMVSKSYNMDSSVGFEFVIPEYDMGKVKAHYPSKQYAKFLPVIQSQIEDYKFVSSNVPDKDMDRLVHGYREQLRYANELSRSIASDRPLSRESAIAPKLFHMRDVLTPLVGDDSVGITSMIANTSTTLTMPDCKDANDRTITCIQKELDIASTSGRPALALNILEYKDLFKPGLCTDFDGSASGKPGEKITCVQYAYDKFPFLQKFGDDVTRDKDVCTRLISRKDFGKVADAPMYVGGKLVPLRDLVCGRVNVRDIAYYLEGKGQDENVTNGHPSRNGTALDVYASKCKCAGAGSPMDRRICADAECWNSYARKNTWAKYYGMYDKNKDAYTIEGATAAMAPVKYHNSDDYWGLSGVYELEYKPSSYRITSTERFNYAHAVQEVLFPAIKRVQGRVLRRFGNFSNVKIEDVVLHQPTSATGDDYNIEVIFTSPDAKEPWSMSYTAASIFIRGGLLNSEDYRTKSIRYKIEEETVEKILTRGTGVSSNTSKLKLVVSNRVSDWLRLSTCQNWSSCMNLYDGCFNNIVPYVASLGSYVAYIASDEFSPTWLAREMVIPVMKTKPGDNFRWDPDDIVDKKPNKTFRGNKVYGLSTYKKLVTDAIKVLLRRNGYNEVGNYHTNSSDDYITSSSHRGYIEKDMEMNARSEAYTACLNLALEGKPTQKMWATDDKSDPCKNIMSRHGIVSIDSLYNSGLLSKRTFDRLEANGYWDTTYLDEAGVSYEITDDALDEIERDMTLTYLKPLTMPTEEKIREVPVLGGNINV
ncbi:MAG TPA: hypothetical protein PLW50_00170 [Smithellaceae bacterium]|nr:hypothetical protein [Smithellaceae bacterium]